MTRLVLSAFICVNLRLIALPLWFEPNQGQAHPSVQFLARTSQGYVYLGRNQMAVQVNGKPVRMSLEDANDAAHAILEEPLDAISSYFSGQTEKDWHTGIPHYARVHYKDVYAGIDLVYYANASDLEYDHVFSCACEPQDDPHALSVVSGDFFACVIYGHTSAYLLAPTCVCRAAERSWNWAVNCPPVGTALVAPC
jgi:hypothetical protein